MAPLLALLAMLVELAAGYPQRLYAGIGHPVTWIGALIARFDRGWNCERAGGPARRRAGALALAVVLAAAIGAGFALQALAGAGAAGLIAAALIASSLIAQRSLAAHVRAVAVALESEGLAAGRLAVAQIVGRDPERLDATGVARAAIESLAENFSDGVVAPVFWLAVAGAPGGIAYKAINTADSMIGHPTPRHADFGRSAARLDDVVNLPASRLGALLIVAAAALSPGASASGAWRAMRRDAARHRSPNAGWPEAAMAGALGVSLAGPRHYAGVLVPDVEMNRGARRDLTSTDIHAALRLYGVADALLILLVALGALAAWRWG